MATRKPDVFFATCISGKENVTCPYYADIKITLLILKPALETPRKQL